MRLALAAETAAPLLLYYWADSPVLVCLLLKLNASPSEIAGVLCKDTSSISSIRSRLFYKVFDKKGTKTLHLNNHETLASRYAAAFHNCSAVIK